MKHGNSHFYRRGRRGFMRAGLGLAGGLALPGLAARALAAEHPPLGPFQ